MNKWIYCGVGAFMMLLLSGCSTPVFRDTIFDTHTDSSQSGSDRRVARIANENQQLTVEISHLREEVKDMKRQQEQLEERLAQSEKQGGSREDIAAVRKDIQLLRAERDTLKREITEDLMARIDKAAARTGGAPATAASSAPARTASSRKTGAATRTGYEHTVVKGQTLSEIARGYGKSVDSIMKANKISNPASIRIGQVLFIPD